MVTKLQKKVFLDIKENRWSLIAIVCICSLGIALFSGINLYVSTVENEVSDYIVRANLADYWIYKTEISDENLNEIKSLNFVSEAQRRKVIDTSVSELSGAVLRIHAIEEPARINMPELINGSFLDINDSNGILLDSRFAEAHGLVVGDIIASEDNGVERQWFIKGIVRNVEYVYYAPEGLTIPDYFKYGFAYTYASALSDVDFNEIVLTIREESNVSQENVMGEIREAFGSANILNRNHQASYRKVSESLTGIKRIGLLFSIAFFLTAALVTWITVSRMMENQRQHFGTLRSLGFSKNELTLRYSLYGVLITIPSMVIGWIISRYMIAEMLYEVGITYYTIEETGVISLSLHYLISVLCVAVITSGATILSCHKSLKFEPAALMRPKPPAKGHRILLERISLFWSRLSFSGKIVVRNLFRNKIRMLMGLVGIIGSTSLILTGFGLMNSINGMLDRTFNDTIQYNVEIKLKNPSTIEQLSDIFDVLEGADNIDATMAFGVYLYGENENIQNPYLVIVDEEQKSLNFKDVFGNTIKLPESGALITPRMADALSVGIGDQITAESLDGTTLSFEIAGIVDFPVGNEVYMSKTAFSKITDIPFLIRTILISGQDFEINRLKDDPRVSLVETKEEMRTNMLIVLETLQNFQIVLIVFSGLLAFAVLMVLGRMNFHERTRELATLKVLGFRMNEMKRLVLRENIWITLFGLPFGYIVGTLLLNIILAQATTPDLEILSQINIISVMIGFAFMMGVTILVNYLIGRNFKNIDMVSSLKSVE